MNEHDLRSTLDVNLLQTSNKTFIRVLNGQLSDLILNNREYFKRCLSRIEAGREELTKRLEEARHVLFSQEEVVHWLYKVKLDAKSETNRIFIEHKATVTASDAEIDFEQAGFLAGMYHKADEFLNTIVAIEPVTSKKAHYTIVDRLEKLDEEFVIKDNIPGYYSIQSDKKISKQKFQLKNLDEYWKEHLSIKDKHKVGEGFGDIRYLLRDYHSEFRWSLVKIRPLEDIKLFLDFHLKHFTGDKVDFMNHIEFRILPELQGVAHSDYPMYRIIVLEWLAEKRNVLNKVEEDYLLNSILAVCGSFVDGIEIYRPNQDENKWNTILTSLLNQRFVSRSWTAKDQTIGGSSNSTSTSNRAGLAFRDIVVVDDSNNNISAIECLRIKSVPTDINANSEISEHIGKVIQNEPLGLSAIFVVVYCETKSYQETWQKYVAYISKLDIPTVRNVATDTNVAIKPERTNIRLATTKIIREGNEIILYHIFINMYPTSTR